MFRQIVIAFATFAVAIGIARPLLAEMPAQVPPDPLTVRRHEKAYTYPQAGWTVLHIEGAPYERGYQHGRLLGREIRDFLQCLATMQSPKAPNDGWRLTRQLVNANFLRGFEPEYLEEMKGIADGASDVGGRFDGRPIDVVDIAGINVWPELITIGSGLEAWPTGLEGRQFPRSQPRGPLPEEVEHCSAFAATGPATADGKIVFGHITMFNLYIVRWFNVWLDVQPDKGHRVLMQSFPGGIQSGTDYYQNDAGLMVTETTIKQTRFDPAGVPLASRIRKALQYGSSIDDAVAILSKDNNGLYTNEWLLGDAKTNEIALFELGTHKSRLMRSSKGEWFGGAEGFYWGCNNTKDLDVRLESYPGVAGRPANVVWRPGDRDKLWLGLYQKNKGKIDADFARRAFTTPVIAAYPSVDVKFTTTDLAKELKSVALFGPPLGRTWHPERELIDRYPNVRPLVSNPWTLLGPAAPTVNKSIAKIRDLPQRIDALRKVDEPTPDTTVPAWHGTLIPKTDGDAWLAAAFADYERYVALEKALITQHGKLTPDDRRRLGVELQAHAKNYRVAALKGDRPISSIVANGSDVWYRLAAGKGVLALNALRGMWCDENFEEAMDTFGRANAGREVTTKGFLEFARKELNDTPNHLLGEWLDTVGLPSVKLGPVHVEKKDGGFLTSGEFTRSGGMDRGGIEVTIETDAGEETHLVKRVGTTVQFEMRTVNEPRRVILDKYGRAGLGGGNPFGLLSWLDDLEHTLIVYGTLDEEAANRETAEALVQAVRARKTNYTLPVRSDQTVSDDELKTNHLLLIGRPSTNRIAASCVAKLPGAFGPASYCLGNERYAHSGSAVLIAGVNPKAENRSVVLLAGLSADATTRTPAALTKHAPAGADVLIVRDGWPARALVAPDSKLTHEFLAKQPNKTNALNRRDAENAETKR